MSDTVLRDDDDRGLERGSGGVVTLTVRPAEPGDAEAVFGLATLMATAAVPERSAFDRSWRSVLFDPEQLLLVAVADPDGVVGYLHGMVHPAFHANGSVGWVEEVCVAGAHRGTGAGRLLMERFETLARSRDVAYVAVATRRAAGFYRALGYEESATYFRRLLPGLD